nr:uncharacterized protein LOC100179512 [Ciona intestinalis]|eukprot:XP_026692356.1 uncharacterized protein LOC100179512 [Ciona intestinalis]
MVYRRWCPAWSKKFPSFYHDKEQNFTYCRLCRCSSIPHAQVCKWATGLTPPSSGWRMRRLVRHLSSFEHQTAHATAVDRCQSVIDYQQKNNGSLPPDAEDPDSILGEADSFFVSFSPVTFRSVLETLTFEELTRKAHSTFETEQLKFGHSEYFKQIKRKSNQDSLRPSLVVKSAKLDQLPSVTKYPDIEADDEMRQVTLEIATNQETSENDTDSEVDLASKELHGDRHDNVNFTTSNGQNGDNFDSSSNIALTLPPSFDELIQTQKKLVKAIEKLVEVQTETLTAVKTLIKQNKNST